MKQRDWAIVGGVALFSAIVSFVLAGKLVTTPANRQQQVQIVSPISTYFNQPDPTYFNNQAIDPTKLIQIGNNANQTPFNDSAQ